MKFILIFLFFISALFAESIFTVKYLEDKSAKLTVEEISSNTQDFQLLDKSKFGFTNSAIWLKITLTNNTDRETKKILEFQDNRLDEIKIYQNRVLLSHIGDLMPFNNREIKSPKATYAFITKANSKSSYYLRITNKRSLNLNYLLYKQTDYEKKIDIEHMFYAFYFGAIVIMILYNFILFLFIKERVFFEYIVYHSLFIIVMLYFNGFFITYYLPDTANLNLGNVPIALASFTTLMATQFARSYLMTKVSVPRMDKLLIFLMGLNFVSMVLNILDIAYIFNLLFSFGVMMVQSLLLLFISFYLVVKRNQSAQFYLIGWGIMLLGVVMVSLISFGIVPRIALTSHLFQIASLFELLLLSMGLAFRYNLQHKLIEKQKQDLYMINKTLENTIADRTEELNQEVQYTKALLKDKDILFKELYHRVKNNLQMMVSILSMQKRRVEGSQTKEILEDITNRIKSLALIHEKLQRSNDLEYIDMKEYLNSLLENIKNSYQIKGLILELNADDIYMNIEQVTSVGLIVNELANNSFKHAFKNSESPKISLFLSKDSDKYHLIYSDNGQGSDKVKTSKSLGSTLIKTLITSQLKGSYEIKTEPSISYSFTFPLK